MAQNPYLKDIESHEKRLSAEVGKHITAALRARDVQQKADDKTNSSTPGKLPPKPVHDVFLGALKKTLSSLPKKYNGVDVAPDVTYEQKDASWIATATATATYRMKPVGGSKVIVKPGDTLWSLAKKTYGHGLYWPAIAAANPNKVRSKGNFILAGVELEIPKIPIPEAPETAVEPLKKVAKKKEKDATRPAVCVMYPTLEFDLEKGSSIVAVFSAPGMTIRITTTLKGAIKAQKKGALPGSFNMRTYETELSNGMKPFESSVKIKSFKPEAITFASNVSGSVWKVSLSFTRDLTLKGAIAPRPVSFTHKDIVYEGSMGMEVEVQIIPTRVRVPDPVPWYEQAWNEASDFVRDNGRAIVGGVIIVGGVVVIGATLAEDVLTAGAGVADDPASFAAASAMFGQGLQMIR
ncbi:MAG: hypothetical protein CML66_02300 [Rhodobacteraceae bacterium]|nr:hypothetical protein [Paracoccaceae bacterium]